MNFKAMRYRQQAMRYESTSVNKIVGDKSHRVTLARHLAFDSFDLTGKPNEFVNLQSALTGTVLI